PVLVSTAFCSIAHSSGASRLALAHRAIQPGWAGAPGAASACGEGEGAGVACAAFGAGVFALIAGGCCASAAPVIAKITAAMVATMTEIFTERLPANALRMGCCAGNVKSFSGLLDRAL